MKAHDTGSFGNRFGSKKGQVLILGSLSTMVLFSTLGLAADLGYSYFTKSQLQTAADAAASAAAVYAYNGGTNSDSCVTLTCPVTYTCAGVTPATNAVQAGCLYAAADAPAGAAITLTESDNAHASSGMTGNSPGMWIKATVTASNHNLFLYWDGFHTASVLGQAVGGFTTVSPGGCIYALSPNATVGVSVTGTSTITTSGCGVYVNSSSATALTVAGSGTVTTSGGSQIVLHCATCYNLGASATTSPAAPYTVAAVTDPLSSLPAPVYSGCDHNGYSKGHSDTDSITHGVFCGGITVSGSAVVTMGPGVYVMNGGGFNVGNSARVIATSGVMIYNTASNGQTAGGVSIGGNARVDLTAPSLGTYSGIAFFQKHLLQNAANISNSALGTITGTYYFPDAPFSFTGNTTTATTAAFIASTVTVSGSSNLTNDSTGKLTGLAHTTIAVMQ